MGVRRHRRLRLRLKEGGGVEGGKGTGGCGIGEEEGDMGGMSCVNSVWSIMAA